MADAVLGAAVENILKKLTSTLFDEIGVASGVRDEVQKLERTLNMIQVVLEDTEKRQLEKESMREWLEVVREVAYDAEDLIDEIQYEELRRKIENNVSSKVRNFFSFSNPLALRLKMAQKIRGIKSRLDEIGRQIPNYCNKNDDSDSDSNSEGKSSTAGMNFVGEVEELVVGRESDQSKIVSMLINHDHGEKSSNGDGGAPISVIPIVGLGGLGKTTLARLVYNDEEVKKHFDLRMWVCVSEADFGIKNLFAEILKQIVPNRTTICQFSTKLGLQNSLETQLNRKKFLLVLDDVWNADQDKWDELTLALKNCGAVRGKIIVTTRNMTLASIVGAEYIHCLQSLSEDDSWDIFERQAFKMGGAERTSRLEQIGKELVKKCRGLPLAVKVLAGLMHSKTKEEEWLAVRESEIWNQMPSKDIEIKTVILLSYNSLPSSLRQCFSYCSLFPKNYQMEKTTLVQLWMAEGFLEVRSHGNLKSLEDVGDEYFKILYFKSFFQDIEKNEFGEIKTCKMHDLVHDLAQFVAKAECQTVEASKLHLNLSAASGGNHELMENSGDGYFRDITKKELENKIGPTQSAANSEFETVEATKASHDILGCRYLLLLFDEEVSAISEALYEMKKLHTFFTLFIPTFKHYCYTGFQRISLPSLFKMRSLRVLDLSNIMVEELPSSIGRLKHLRYLNLSHTRIGALPHSIIELYNLETLNLLECRQLHKLPKSLRNLSKLRHFYVDDTGNWDETPSGLERLTSLRTLPILKLCSQSAGSHIAELETLNYLGGKLDIYGLEHVKDVELAVKADLSQKKDLEILNLHLKDWRLWDMEEEDNNYDFQDRVLEALQPHSNLKEIGILEFQGIKFPWWMANGSVLPSLVKLTIKGCNKCERIKSFGELPSLKELKICDMSNMRCFGDDVTKEVAAVKASRAVVAYPSLEKLTLHCIPKLEEWLENGFLRYFPQLEELTLSGCPKLRKTPNLFSSLQILSLHDVGEKGVSSLTSGLTSLTSLSIKGSKDLKFLSEGRIEKNYLLDRLQIRDCLKFHAFVSHSLRILEIRDCPVIESIPDLSGLTLLQELTICQCKELETIAEARLHLLHTLKVLDIQYCPKLRIGATDPLPHLRRMSLYEINVIVLDDAWADKMGSLVELSIRSVPELRELPIEFLQNNKHLEKVSIYDCAKFQGFRLSKKEQDQVLHTSHETLQRMIHFPKLSVCSCKRLKSLEGLQFLGNIEELRLGPFSEELDYFPFPAAAEINDLASSLHHLHVNGWSNLKSMPQQLQHLRALNLLLISDFNGLMALPEWLGEFTSLQILIIQNCKNLMHLPSMNALQRLTSLKTLFIDKCPLLQERCNRKRGGEEWHKISHISQVKLGVRYHTLY